MLNKISDRFHGWAKGWLVLLFLALDALFMFFVMPIAGALMAGDAGGPGPLDLKFFYAPQAFEIIKMYGEYGRVFYRNIEVTLDIIYPVVYTLFYGLLLSWVFQRGFKPNHKIQKWNVVPVFAWFFDLLENVGIVSMLSLFPATPVALAWITNLFTPAKWFFAFLSMGLALLGLVRAAMNKFQKQA